MELLARRAFNNGDMENAATLFASLARLHANGVSSHGHSQFRYFRYMSACCRVLATPLKVALPYRYRDLCHALLMPELTADFFIYPEEVVIEGGNVDEECQRTVIEHINKRFQQLVLCVHPDKNPHHRAGEAFVRLRSLHEEAIQLVNNYFVEERSGGNTSGLFCRRGDNELGEEFHRKYRNSKRRKSKVAEETNGMRKHKRSSSNGKDKFKLPELSSLKRQRITLKSLKRKQIDDNFQIFKDERKRRIRCNYRLSISMNSSHMFSDSDSDDDSGSSTNNDINTSINASKRKSKGNKQTLRKTTNNADVLHCNGKKHRGGCDDGVNCNGVNRKRKNSNAHLASTVPTLPVLSSASSSFSYSESSLPFNCEYVENFFSNKCNNLDDDGDVDGDGDLMKCNKMFGLRLMSLKERIQERRGKKKENKNDSSGRSRSNNNRTTSSNREESLETSFDKKGEEWQKETKQKSKSKNDYKNAKSKVVQAERNTEGNNNNIGNCSNPDKSKLTNKRSSVSTNSTGIISPSGLSVSCTSISDSTETDEAKDNIRARLENLKNQLEKMRLTNTKVHLTSDLSYETYIKEKVHANAMEAKVIFFSNDKLMQTQQQM